MTTTTLFQSALWNEFEVVAKARKRQPYEVLAEMLNDYVRAAKAESPVVEMPTHQAVSDEEILSVWAGREESAQEIARQIRQRNRQVT